MEYVYHESEKFRANLFFLVGTVLCTPTCIVTLDYLRDNEDVPSQLSKIECFILFILGYLSITHGYGILVDKEEEIYGIK